MIESDKGIYWLGIDSGAVRNKQIWEGPEKVGIGQEISSEIGIDDWAFMSGMSMYLMVPNYEMYL